MAETNNLWTRNCFEKVDIVNLEKGAKILSSTFLPCIENVDSTNEKHKARHVVQGNEDKEKTFLVHQSSTLKIWYVQIIISFASISNYKLWSQDIPKANI